MSKAAIKSLGILAVLFILVLGFSFVTFSDKVSLEKAKGSLEKQVEEFRARTQQQATEIQNSQNKIKEIEKVKVDLEERVKKFEGIDLEEMQKKIAALTTERDDWQKRVETVGKERDDLVAKIGEATKELNAYKEASAAPQPAAAAQPAEETKQAPPPGNEDEYWAQILKEKAVLSLEVEKVKQQMSANAVELVEIKKQNSDLQLELSKVKNDKAAIEREIKYGTDLADTLSLELARAKNDKKFLDDRMDKFSQENTALREQIKRLTSTKIALEKSIVRLQDEKTEIEKKLSETENVIQNRIDQIWEIKESLEKSVKPAPKAEAGEVELPPIVVSPQEGMPVANPSIDPNVGVSPGFQGKVVSVNEENNFIIVDIGEMDGVKLGDTLSVYRDAEYIAGLEVIQVRKDICAADIKNKIVKLQVGDTIR